MKVIKWRRQELVLEQPKLSYGFIRGTKGEDGSALDCFVGQRLDSSFVFIFPKLKKSGVFDETKVMIGFETMNDAAQAWIKKYGSKVRLGTPSYLPVREFLKDLKKKWHK